MKVEGYEETHDRQCVTIFSAPNYCDVQGNKAAYIHLKGDTLIPKFVQFEAVVLIELCSLTLRSDPWHTRTTLGACSDKTYRSYHFKINQSILCQDTLHVQLYPSASIVVLGCPSGGCQFCLDPRSTES